MRNGITPTGIAALYVDGRLIRRSSHEIHTTNALFLAAVHMNGSAPFAELPASFERKRISLGRGRHVQIAAREFHFFPEPKRSYSGTSGALYLGRSRDKRRGWLLQLLPPNVHTSRHFHKVKTERFINLAGRCVMGVHHVELDVTGRDYTVRPDIPHYLRTLDEPALNLLIISGLSDPLTMEDHHYLDLPLSFPEPPAR